LVRAGKGLEVDRKAGGLDVGRVQLERGFEMEEENMELTVLGLVTAERYNVTHLRAEFLIVIYCFENSVHKHICTYRHSTYLPQRSAYIDPHPLKSWT
jgi:hypothetical protein